MSIDVKNKPHVLVFLFDLVDGLLEIHSFKLAGMGMTVDRPNKIAVCAILIC